MSVCAWGECCTLVCAYMCVCVCVCVCVGVCGCCCIMLSSSGHGTGKRLPYCPPQCPPRCLPRSLCWSVFVRDIFVGLHAGFSAPSLLSSPLLSSLSLL